MNFSIRTGPPFPGAVTPSRALGRSFVVAAQETVSLVLNEDAPVPESDQDVLDLVLRLRGHLAQLGSALDSPARPLADALDAARALAADELPEGFMPSRVYLRKLALSVQAVVEELPWPRPAAPEALGTPTASPVLPDTVKPDPGLTAIESGLTPLPAPWRGRSTAHRNTSPELFGWRLHHRIPVLAAELVAVLLRQVRRLRPLRVHPLQRLVDLDERRFLQVCCQLSVTQGAGPR
ncbi:DUF6415 family natural product biosynthesis protein [Streptomyces sp. NPDC058471]|uniref:DUF6415 family natural product biosynthesis protein n=1 Tax=Streptomyces sp. NPDC058471 TaxID=3346516 RepID=UPI00364695DA